VQLERMYHEIILDHYRSPHGSGLREPFDAESFQVNPTCGDEITLRVRLDGDTVADVSHETLGCSISQASASVLTELVVGRSVADSMRVLSAFQAMTQGRGQVEPDEEVLGDGVAFAGVARYPARVKCALLGWMAFKDAVVRTAQVETAQVETAQVETAQVETAQVETAQVETAQVETAQVRTAQVRTAQVRTAQSRGGPRTDAVDPTEATT